MDSYSAGGNDLKFALSKSANINLNLLGSLRCLTFRKPKTDIIARDPVIIDTGATCSAAKTSQSFLALANFSSRLELQQLVKQHTMNRSTVLTKHQLMLETISSSRFLTGWTQHQKARPTTNLVRCWTFDLALVHLSNVLPPDRGVQQRTRFVVGRAPFQCFVCGDALLATGFGCLKEPSGHSHQKQNAPIATE